MDNQNKTLNHDSREDNKPIAPEASSGKVPNQNQNHNTKKAALGPNTKR